MDDLIENKKCIVKAINFYHFPKLNSEKEHLSLNANIGFNLVKYESKEMIIGCNYDVYSFDSPVDISLTLLVLVKLNKELDPEKIPFEQIASDESIIKELDKKIFMLNSLVNIDLPLISEAKERMEK